MHLHSNNRSNIHKNHKKTISRSHNYNSKKHPNFIKKQQKSSNNCLIPLNPIKTHHKSTYDYFSSIKTPSLSDHSNIKTFLLNNNQQMKPFCPTKMSFKKNNAFPPKPFNNFSTNNILSINNNYTNISFNIPSISSQKIKSSVQQRRMSSNKADVHEEVGVSPPSTIEDTIFGKMTRGEIDVPKVYEDDKCIVINDLYPQAKVHMLVIPRKPITQISKAEEGDKELLGHLYLVAQKAAKIKGIEDYRLVVNSGKDACQSVYHLHIHILGGEQLTGNFA